MKIIDVFARAFLKTLPSEKCTVGEYKSIVVEDEEAITLYLELVPKRTSDSLEVTLSLD